jgi:hypothetical protein
MRRLLQVSAGLLLVAAGAATAAAQREPTVQKELRERFGEWAERYPADMPSYSALETVEQTRWDRKGNAGEPRRAVFRYVLKRTGERREWVETRLAPEKENASTAAKGTNLVPSGREAPAFGNLPYDLFTKLPMLISRLATRNQEKMRFFFLPDETDAVSDLVVIGYRQMSGEGLMEVDGKPSYPTGRAWIDPEEGRVVRMEEEFGGKDTRYWIAIDNTLDQGERGWLPVKISIRLFEKGRLEVQNNYTYSEIRILKD